MLQLQLELMSVVIRSKLVLRAATSLTGVRGEGCLLSGYHAG